MRSAHPEVARLIIEDTPPLIGGLLYVDRRQEFTYRGMMVLVLHFPTIHTINLAFLKRFGTTTESY